MNALSKIVDAIDHIAANPRGVTVTELADLMGTSKSTSSRLLASMIEAGLVERDDAQRHVLDVRFWTWGVQSVRRLSVLDVARPHVLAAVANHGVAAYVAVARGNKAIYLESFTILSGAPFMNLVSYVVPIYACAPGKALLAHLPQEQIDEVLAGRLERFTPNTLASREELEAELSAVKKEGYALNRGEYADNGRMAIAVPVFDHTARPVASVCFHAITEEAQLRELVEPLRTLGMTISTSLGYSLAMQVAVG